MVANALANILRAGSQRLESRGFPMKRRSINTLISQASRTPPGLSRPSRSSLSTYTSSAYHRSTSDPVYNRSIATKAHLIPSSRPSLARALASRLLIYRAGLSPLSASVRTECLHSSRPSVRLLSHSSHHLSRKTTRTDPPERDEHRSNSRTSHSSEEHFTKEEGYHFLNRLPDLSQRFHRPTKEELLAAATGFWSRLRVRFKWFSIRSVRPFNVDEISAFVTWILAGHLVWILLGTTTFFSLLILALNTVFAQETLAGWVGNYLTKSSGVKVVFESAIVPKWRDGVITFKNVFVSRRPGQHMSKVSKGSPTSAVAAAAARALAEKTEAEQEEDTNYTQYDLSIETVNVTLSFAKWVNGRGLLKDVEIKGIRGVVDRTSIRLDGAHVDPRSYKHQHNTGDFELESFKMEDLLVSVYQPGGFRPFSVSIFSADLPQLRKQWLFYDFLSAHNVSGSFDGSPFFIHPRQTHNVTGALLERPVDALGTAAWKKQSRIRVDGLNIDHLNKGVEGPFGWISEGNVDIVADIMFPADDDESLGRIVSEFYDKVEASVTNHRYLGLPKHSSDQSMEEQRQRAASSHPERPKPLIMDMRIHLNDVYASIPLFQNHLTSTSATLIRPIVAYINSNRTFIPINCRVIKPVSDFDGSWTIYDSLLMSEVSNEVFDAFARDVVDEQKRRGRVKKVVVWSLGLAVKALLLGLAGNVA